MMIRSGPGFAAAALLAAVMVSASMPASAQQAPAPGAAPQPAAGAAKAKAKTAAKKKTPPKNASEIVIVNGRSAVVTAVSVTSAAGKSAATLKKPLEAGKKISIRLPKNSGCTFSINASFSDDAEFDQSEVNLCLDKTVRFTE